MSTKASTQPSRRTPLSLSGATSKQQQQQQQQQSTNSRNDKPTTSNQKTEQTATTTSTQKDNKNNKQQQLVDKKTQQQITKVASNNTTTSGSVKKPERSDEKKTQNGVGNGNSNSGNAKEKHQNGKEASANENLKDKKESKIEKVEKNEKPAAAANIDKKEKLEKEKEKKKEQEKEKEKDTEIEKVKAMEKEKPEIVKKEKEELAKKEKPDLAQMEKEEALQKEQEMLLEKEKEKSKDVENKPEKETRSKRNIVEATEKKHQQDDDDDDDVEQMDISANDEKSAKPATPTRRSAVEHKFETPKKQDGEKQSTQVSPSKATLRSATPSSNQSFTSLTYTTNVRSVTTTTCIDDLEMEPLLVEEGSPKRSQTVEKQTTLTAAAPAPTEPKPAATSTPGKFLTFKEIFFSESPKKVQQIASSKFPDRNSCPRSFSQISGRRSIRPGNDAYTYSYFQNYAQYPESYRRINTELDATSNTNTSLNVTVGSEVPNNSSFSFFGRGCKRERTPPNVVTQSTVDLDLEISPKSPKRARIDMHGFFSVVASPLTLLRSRFSKTSIQSSTPVKLRLSSKLSAAESAEDEEVEVQNVSGVSVEEELEPAAIADADDTATEDITVDNEGDEKKELSTSSSSDKHESAVNVEAIPTDADAVPQEPKLEKLSAEHAIEADCKNTKNTIEETVNTAGGLVGGGDAVVKNKKCSIM